MTTWDATFESLPADTDLEKYGAGKIRELKTAISDRMDLEHDFKATGRHLPGISSVVYEGTTAQIAALTGVSVGCFAFDTDLGQWKRYDGSSWVAHSSILTASAAGTVDAITATFSPGFTTLSNNIKCCVIASGANTLTNPTFAPNGLAAKTIVKGNNLPLIAGDIPGANFPAWLMYSTTFNAWVLLNPAYAVSTPQFHFALLQNRQASNVFGATFTINTWVPIQLNTVQADPDGIVDGSNLASNYIFGLAAGTYVLEATIILWGCRGSQGRLYNVTDSTVVFLGSSTFSSSDSYLPVRGIFTITSTKTFRLECQVEQAGQQGYPGNRGGQEVYSQLSLTKTK